MADWRYTPYGEYRHAVQPGMAGAECGRTVLPASEWRGTGSQTEYERVAGLPDCQRCVHKVGPAVVAKMTAECSGAVAR